MDFWGNEPNQYVHLWHEIGFYFVVLVAISIGKRIEMVAHRGPDRIFSKFVN